MTRTPAKEDKFTFGLWTVGWLGPEVAEALAASRVPELATPTLGAGEGWRELLGADADFDVEAAAARGMHYERLDQLAMDHLLGAR